MGKRSGVSETDAQIGALTVEELRREIRAAEQMAGVLREPARKGLLKRLHRLNKVLLDRLAD